MLVYMAKPLELADLVPGTQLGHYVISNRIAQGGMGTVFRATEPALERYVAIKVLRPEYATNPEYVQYFQEEARAVAALRHPNIVPIFYIGQEGNVVFFSMSYIEGETFDDWVETKRLFDDNHARWFLSHAIAALHSAHKANIVHLDIKPANFLVDRANNIMLTDFGLAEKIVKAADENVQREAFGTPAYVSPEQITRDKTDQRTDIYSLGATLFHLMTGRAPFEGKTVEEIVWGHLEKPFPIEVAQAANLPLGWIYLLKKMMERDPVNRFADYRELRTAFADVENFRYETDRIEVPRNTRGICIPRTGRSTQTLHGILAQTKSQWAIQEEKAHGSIQYTREQVFEVLKTRPEPLKLDGLLGTIRDLCVSRQEDPAALAEAMNKVPGYGPALCALADFMTGPAEASEKAARQDPVVVLETVGLERSRHLALTFFAINYEFQNTAQFDWSPLWRHQISTGVILDFLYDALSLKRVGTEYAAGTVHEIGRLILAEIFPFACFTAMNRALKEEISLTACELETFSIDHAELGAIWLREKQLPQSLVDAIMFHDTPEKIPRRALLPHALASANQLVKQLGIGYSGNPWLDPHPWEEMPSTRIIWEARGNKEYLFENFTQDILGQFGHFPDLI
jgi:serine/threonine protein kinase